MKLDLTNKIKGGIIGLLVGDALGVPYEFHAKEEIPPFDEIEFEPPNSFQRAHAGVPVGTWSDDGAQALILLNSLLECGKFDVAHFAEGLVDWYDRGFMAVGGVVFDVGIQTSESIRELKSGISPKISGGFDEYSNGNGSLMRVLPLALWHRGSDEELVRIAFDQSAVTHGHLRSKLCCALYCLWARNILNENESPFQTANSDLKKLFENNEEALKELEIVNNYNTANLNGSGYVVDSLHTAIDCFEQEDSYEYVVKKAISYGNDTDTTACIAGGIAGIKFGIDGIPQRWRENLRGKEICDRLIEKLLEYLRI